MQVGSFHVAFEDLENINMRKQLLFSRTGAVAAFTLLDVDESGSLTGDEFAEIIKAVSKNEQMEFTEFQIKHIFTRVDKDFNGEIDIREFVEGIDIVFEMADSVRLASAFNPVWKIYETGMYQGTIFLLLLAHFTTLMLYGVSSSFEEYWGELDKILIFLMGIFIVDLVIQIFVMSPHVFWNYSNYISDGIEKQFANRFNFVLCTSAALLIIVGFISEYLTGEHNHYLLRFAAALPVSRVIIIFPTLRHLIWCLVLILPMFIDLLVFLFLIFYVFAYWGLYLFYGKFDLLTYYDMHPGCDFNSLPQALLLLFQLLVGEAWNSVTYAGIRVTDWFYAMYFVIFFVIVAILFTNLFVGVILSVYQLALPLKNPTFLSIMTKRR